MNTSRFDAWIHGSFRASGQGLAFYRIVFAAFTLLVIAPGHDLYTDLHGFASLPSSMFVPPPGPMMLFGGFPSVLTAEVLLGALNVCLVAVLFGYRTRLFSIGTGLLLLTIFGFSYSAGKINHNFLFILVPIVMAFSNWGEAYSYDARFRSGASPAAESWPLTLLVLLLGFAMFTAGFAKILGGWLDPETQAAYGHVVKHYVVRGRTDLLAPLAFRMDNGVFWEVQDYATVLFETGFLAAVAYPRLARTFAGLAVLFHFGVMLTMNIAFAFNLVVYAAFVDWDGIHRVFRRQWPRIPSLPASRALTICVLLFTGLIFYRIGSPLMLVEGVFPLNSDLLLREVLAVSAAVVLVVGSAVRLFASSVAGAIARRTRQSISSNAQRSTIGTRGVGDAGGLRAPGSNPPR